MPPKKRTANHRLRLRVQDARHILGNWRSCKTDNDRTRFLKDLRKTHPTIADNLARLMEQPIGKR